MSATTTRTTTVLVLAKEPVPGRVKTRLCPPLTPGEAAAVAAAAIADTLDAALACGAGRVLLALEGHPGAWVPDGVEVVPQVGGGLARRLAAAWSHVDGPAVQIGMDTPQVAPADLRLALSALDGADAALGLAEDGGWWAIALHRPDPRCFLGVPMSTPTTGSAQRRRLAELGLRVADLPVLRDVDDADDLAAVAAGWPSLRTAAVGSRLLAAGPA